MGKGPGENEEDEEVLIEDEKLLQTEDKHNTSSYGFTIAVSGSSPDEEKRLLSQGNVNSVTKNEEQLTLLKLSKSSPSKDKCIDLDQSKSVTIKDDQGLDNSNQNDVSEEIEEQEKLKKKMPRKHLQLHLDVEAGAKKAIKSFGNTLDTPTPTGYQGSPKPMNVAVFLKEGQHRLLLLEKGKLTTAGELKIKMLETLSIPKSASRLFAIWFISPFLEIQLQSDHIPFLLRKQWSQLLMSFSGCQNQDDAIKDEPILVFQRNSFLRVEDEEEFDEDTVVKRLFEEARYNVLMARYPIPVADAEKLGGILARISEGPYDMEKHKSGFFKNSLQKFLPYYAIGTNKIMEKMKSAGTERRLICQFEEATKNFTYVKACQINFLKYCRSKKYYGSAFFKGMIQQNLKDYRPWRTSEKQLNIGINRKGISLFKVSKEEMIVHIPYDALSWDYVKDETDECLDLFCIEFDAHKNDGDEALPEKLDILSKQACMMDGMVDSCINYMNIMNIPKTPTSAGFKKPGDISYSWNSKIKNPILSLSRSFKK